MEEARDQQLDYGQDRTAARLQKECNSVDAALNCAFHYLLELEFNCE